MLEIAEKFDKAMKHIIFSAEKPTPDSVTRIEAHLGVKLPTDLIEFAKLSVKYGNWLASIGPDYDSTTHIIKLNMGLRAEKKLPENVVALNVGYDNDWDCFDVETFDPNTGEYLITSWSDDVSQSESNLYGSFKDYICKHIDFWLEST